MSIEELLPTFSNKEYDNYVRQKDKCFFKNPIDEYEWSKTQYKLCSICNINKNLNNFSGNTSGCDAFNKNGYRLRRPECIDCNKEILKGKQLAKKLAKEKGITYKAPEGSVCAICNKSQTENNKLVFDHNHITNEFRGYCCNSCNRSLGVFGDNVEGLIKALNYILVYEPTIINQNKDGLLVIMK